MNCVVINSVVIIGLEFETNKAYEISYFEIQLHVLKVTLFFRSVASLVCKHPANRMLLLWLSAGSYATRSNTTELNIARDLHTMPLIRCPSIG